MRVSTDPDTGQTILAGMGELHLEIIVDRMQREFNVGANVGKPQVAYRETIRSTAEYDYTHKKQTGGSGQYARTKLRVEPNPGKGFEFENEVQGGTIPKEFIPAIEKGVRGGARRRHSGRLSDGGRESGGSSTALITKSIRRKWRSRSAAPSASRKPAAKPSRCCWNR